MPTTRSANKQLKLEDVVEDQKTNQASSNNKSTKACEPNPSNKRKSTASSKDPPAKAPKQVRTDPPNATEDAIVINRAPVLTLWGATVAQLLHSELSWKTCLGIGNSISTLCAISKGRSIGVMESKEDGDSGKKNKKPEAAGVKHVAVMGFPMQLKGEDVVVDGNLKPFNESNLIGKFGGEEKYDQAKAAFGEALRNWEGEKDELDNKAFHMYEQFRPAVAGGQKGWGRKGKLDLEEVKKIASK